MYLGSRDATGFLCILGLLLESLAVFGLVFLRPVLHVILLAAMVCLHHRP